MSTRRRGRDDRAGFTLIELLVVIAIIAVLIALLAARGPGGPRGGAADAVREQHEADRPGDRQLRVEQWAASSRGTSARPCLWPFFGVPGNNPDPQTGDNGPGWGWLALLLP